MKIEAGKFYRTRDGQKVGPMRRNRGNDYWPWVDSDEAGHAWTNTGGTGCHCTPQAITDVGLEIIAEWSETIVYRVKPAPPKPRTIYLCEVHDTRTVFDTAMAATREALEYQHGEARVSEWEEKVK